MKTSLCWMIVMLGASACAQAQAQAPVADAAQSWSNKPLRTVAPFTAGSATDAVARFVAEKLGSQLGQNFVVENRPGAGGTIGMAVVAVN